MLAYCVRDLVPIKHAINLRISSKILLADVYALTDNINQLAAPDQIHRDEGSKSRIRGSEYLVHIEAVAWRREREKTEARIYN